MGECSLVRMIQLPLPREHRYIYPINGLFVFRFLASVYQSRIEQPQRLLGQLTENSEKRRSSLTFKKSGGAAGPSDFGSGGETVMAAATELVTIAGIRAVCQTLALPRASDYRKLHPGSS